MTTLHYLKSFYQKASFEQKLFLLAAFFLMLHKTESFLLHGSIPWIGKILSLLNAAGFLALFLYCVGYVLGKGIWRAIKNSSED